MEKIKFKELASILKKSVNGIISDEVLINIFDNFIASKTDYIKLIRLLNKCESTMYTKFSILIVSHMVYNTNEKFSISINDYTNIDYINNELVINTYDSDALDLLFMIICKSINKHIDLFSKEEIIPILDYYINIGPYKYKNDISIAPILLSMYYNIKLTKFAYTNIVYGVKWNSYYKDSITKVVCDSFKHFKDNINKQELNKFMIGVMDHLVNYEDPDSDYESDINDIDENVYTWFIILLENKLIEYPEILFYKMKIRELKFKYIYDINNIKECNTNIDIENNLLKLADKNFNLVKKDSELINESNQ
jgi:hypothetical protein